MKEENTGNIRSLRYTERPSYSAVGDPASVLLTVAGSPSSSKRMGRREPSLDQGSCSSTRRHARQNPPPGAMLAGLRLGPQIDEDAHTDDVRSEDDRTFDWQQEALCGHRHHLGTRPRDGEGSSQQTGVLRSVCGERYQEDGGGGCEGRL